MYMKPVILTTLMLTFRACLNNPNWSLRVAILRVNTFKIA